jgi:hypothetical protein
MNAWDCTSVRALIYVAFGSAQFILKRGDPTYQVGNVLTLAMLWKTYLVKEYRPFTVETFCTSHVTTSDEYVRS